MLLLFFLTTYFQLNVLLARDMCALNKEWETSISGPDGHEYYWLMYDSKMTYYEAEAACSCYGDDYEPAKIADTSKWNDIYESLKAANVYQGSDAFYIGAVSDSEEEPISIDQISDVTFGTTSDSQGTGGSTSSGYEEPMDGNCPGNDLNHNTLNSVAECAALCSTDGACAGFVYTTVSGYGANCWTKSSLCEKPYALAGFSVHKSTTFGLSKYGEPVAGNCPGNDINHQAGITVEACAALCTTDDTCVGFVYGFGDSCWTKSLMCSEPYGYEGPGGLASYYQNDDTEGSTPSGYEAPMDGNCPGNDLNHYTLNSVAECAASCSTDGACAGFVYATVSGYGANCWTKSSLCEKPYALAGFSVHKSTTFGSKGLSMMTVSEVHYCDLQDATLTASKVHDPSNRPLSLATDGDTGNDGFHVCTVVKAAAGSEDVWLQVDLGQEAHVIAVELLPRADDGGQMKDFQVYVGGTVDTLTDSNLCTSYDGRLTIDGNMQRLDCDTVLSGQYVTVRKTKQRRSAQYLTVCELNVLVMDEMNNEGQVGFTVDKSLEFVKLSDTIASGVLCEEST